MIIQAHWAPVHGRVRILIGVMAAGNGDLAEGEGVVHDGREEVNRLDQGRIVVEPVDGGVVRRRDPY